MKKLIVTVVFIGFFMFFGCKTDTGNNSPVHLDSEEEFYWYTIKPGIVSYLYLSDAQRFDLENLISENELIILKLKINEILSGLEGLDPADKSDEELNKFNSTISFLNEMHSINDMGTIKGDYCQKHRYLLSDGTAINLFLDHKIRIIVENRVTKNDLSGLKAYIRNTIVPWLNYERDLYDDDYNNTGYRNNIRRIDYTIELFEDWYNQSNMETIKWYFTKKT